VWVAAAFLFLAAASPTSAGARVTADSAYVVFAAEDRGLLNLAKGWTLRPGPRPEDFVLGREEAK
jgi:hypothetical protein